MKKSALLKKAKLLFFVLFFITSVQAQQSLTQITGWNAYVHLPDDYSTSSKVYPTIIFFPGIGEVGTNAGLVIANGPGAYMTQGWNGDVTVDGNVTKFIVISLQPPTAWPSEATINSKIQTIKSLYRVDNQRLYLTGLSMGGWCATKYVSKDPLGGPYTYASQVAAIVNVEGVVPDNNPFPQIWDNYANAGGKLLCFEQSNDFRDMQKYVDRMNLTKPNSAIYMKTTFNGGGHCCWEQFYGGGGVQPVNFNLGGITQNIYQWLARQVMGSQTNNPPVAPVITSGGTASGNVASAFSYTITAANIPSGYNATGLPSGLTINAQTGVISGTLTVAGTYNVTITASNTAGTASKTLVITIANQVIPACTGSIIVDAPSAPIIDQNVDAVWTKAPANTITKVINGSMPADFSGSKWRAMYDNTNLYVLVEVKDNNKINDSGTNWWEDDVVEIFIDGDNSKRSSYDGVNDFQLGFRYNDPTIKIGGSSVTRTTGISFAIQNISGGYNLEVAIPWSTIGVTPYNGKPLGFEIEVDDDDNGGTRDGTVAAFASSNMAYANPGLFGTVNLTVCNGSTGPVTPEITSATSANSTVGNAFNYAITASNNPTSYNATGLPAGLSVNTSSGIISGTPTVSGIFSITVSATNGGGTGTKAVTLTIATAIPSVPVISSATSANGIVGSVFNYTIIASNSPSSYSASGLPAGLSVNTSTGLINGTPTLSGTFNVTIGATNAGGTGTKSLTVTIANAVPTAPVISSSATANGIVGVAFSYIITASNNPTNYSASVLPAGLNLNTVTGVISGIPTSAATSSITVSATNAGGTGTKVVSISIMAAGDPEGVITCYKSPGVITVNGMLSESGWNITKAITKTTVGSVNNTASFGVLWDNTNLYIGVKVLDANLYNESADMWEDDAVEIYIDANYNKLGNYDGRDNQIIKGYNKSTIFSKLSIAGLQHAVVAITGGYSVELAIPWSELGITAPANGTTIGIDIGYDDDDNGGARDGQATWNGTINNYQNTSAFGKLVLSSTIASGNAARPAKVNTANEARESLLENKVAVKLFPNPVSTGNVTMLLSGINGNVDIEITDAKGVIVRQINRKISVPMFNLTTSELSPGIYFVRIAQGNKLIIKQLLVQ